MSAVTPTARVPHSPTSSCFREVAADDAALPLKKSAGINCCDFDEVVVVATPVAPCTAATIEPHFWAEHLDATPNGGFVPEATPVTMTMAVPGTRKVFRVAHSESVFFEVTGMAGGGKVRLEVYGVPVYGRLP